MGLRGPGAKPIKRKAGPARVGAGLRQPWEAKGLTRVERVVAFIESLPVTSGMHAGRRMKVRPWQRKFLDRVYATDPEGHRPVRTALLSMARKNGKTGLAAPLALCHLAGPEAEERGEVYAAANDKGQAAKLYAEMAAIVERVPFLDERISLRRHVKEMEDLGGTGSIFAALSADVATKHGLSPSFVVYDELGQAANRHLFDVLDTAMGARDEPLMLVISTQAASDFAPMSELVDYGLRVNAGEVDDPAFVLDLHTAPPEADPWSPETWALANPALGDFRSLEDVERQAAQAQRIPSKEAAFRNLILNQRIDAESAFITLAEWRQNGAAPQLADNDERPCFAALDIGGTRDLTALVRVYPDEEGTLDVLPEFWLPGDDLADREERDRVPYRTWRDRGFLNLTPGRTADPRFIAARVAEIHRARPIRALAFDRWRIEDFRRALAEEGVYDLELVDHGQGFRDMGPAVDAFERAVADRKLRHGHHPVLTWCVTNARVVRDPAGNAKLDKSRSTGRIDGAVALAMAISVAERLCGEPAEHYLERRELRAV